MNNYRKLLVLGINELLAKKLISLDPKEDSVSEETYRGHIISEIAGYPSVIIWEDIGFEEFRISVWWNYDHTNHPQANLSGNARENFRTPSPLAKRSKYKNFVGVTVSGWLKRRTGKYLMGKGRRALFDIYTRRQEKPLLEKLPEPKPNGFLVEGTFHS